LDFIKKHAIKIPVLLYVLGFAVHNSYLSQFGSYEFELIQARYVLSGFGFLGFVTICIEYTSIQINLSYIADSYQLDRLFPWILRVVSFPGFIYGTLYSDSVSVLVKNADALNAIQYFYYSLSSFVVLFTLTDLIFMQTKGNSYLAKFIRSSLRILAVPMVLIACSIAWYVPEFSGILKTTIFFFFGYVGISLYQADEKHGVKTDYLDERAKEEHENVFQLLIGIIAIFLLLWTVISNYSNFIYPKFPTALGGSKIEPAQLYVKDKVIISNVVQETDRWFLIINSKTGFTEKIKASSVDKVVYQNIILK
jgi:hypothetical protein